MTYLPAPHMPSDADVLRLAVENGLIERATTYDPAAAAMARLFWLALGNTRLHGAEALPINMAATNGGK